LRITAGAEDWVAWAIRRMGWAKMHGQKKRRKRSLDGTVIVEGISLAWRLISEPQWTTEDGLLGLRLSVRMREGSHRELILEFPFPKKTTGNGLPQFPQRPKFTEQAVEHGIRQAIIAGWEPESRGKAFVHRMPA
jgi:hypothetical protein